MSSLLHSTSRPVPQQEILCPECGSSDLVEDADRGEVSCARCGLVVEEDLLDRSPEWRAFTLEERQRLRRTGPPTANISYDKGLSTTFQTYKDAFGKTLSLKTRRRMYRLRRLNLRARLRDSSSRNLLRATGELRRLSDRLNIPNSVRETAANIYRRALNKDLVRGRSIDAIAAASLYAACRMSSTPRDLRGISEVSSRGMKEISRSYRLILKELGLRMPIDSPIKFVSKIRSKIGVSQAVENRALEILREADGKGLLTGKHPVGMAAAAVYIATRLKEERVSQKEIAEVSGVTEVTVRNRYKGILEGLDIELS